MRWILLIFLISPCHALETYICQGVQETYSCELISPEEEYLEDVIHVYESDGMNSVQEQYEAEEAPLKEPEKDYIPFIFPRSVFW